MSGEIQEFFQDTESSIQENDLAYNALVPPDPPEGPDQERLMRLQAELNRVNQTTPYGSLQFSGEGDATFALDPRLQQEFEQRTDLRNALLENAMSRTGQLPTGSFDPNIPQAGQMGNMPQALNSGVGQGVQGGTPGATAGASQAGLARQAMGAGQSGGFGASGGGYSREAAGGQGGSQGAGLAAQVPQAMDSGQLAGRMPTPGGQAGGALGPMDQSTQTQQAQFERAMSLMEPQFERQGEQARQRLANQGLPMGGEAYEGELDRMDQAQSRAMEDAAFRAVQAGNQRQSQIFQQGQADVAQRAGLQGQEFQQGLSGVNQLAGLQGQEFQQGMAGFQAGGQRQNQLFQQGMAQLGAQQQARQQNLNEIQAMLAGQQVGQNIEGQGQNLGSFYSPSNIDVLGAAGLEQQGDLAQYNAQQEQTSGNLSGLGSLATSLFCSRDYKENRRPVSEILPRIDALPVEAWDYREGYGDGQTHIGPYAEDFQRLFGVGDGETIHVVDLCGVLILGVQELSQRVKELENG